MVFWVFFWSYLASCRILVPWPGVEPRARQWKYQVLTAGPSGISMFLSLFEIHIGLPCGPVVKNSPANAEDMGSTPGLGRFYMPRGNKAQKPQLLSLSSTACVLQVLSPRAATTQACTPRTHELRQEKPLQWEACATQLESSPCLPQAEKAHKQQQRPSAAKMK